MSPHPNVVTLHQAFAQLEGGEVNVDTIPNNLSLSLATTRRASVRWERLVQSVFVMDCCDLGTLQASGLEPFTANGLSSLDSLLIIWRVF